MTALVAAAWSAVMLWPVLRAPTSTVPMDAGDPLLNASILQWNAVHTPMTREWWNFPSYAPTEGVTTFTEHLLGLWPLTSPLIWLTNDPVLAYNVAFYLSFVCNALAMYAFVRVLTGSVAGAMVAALAFTFNPYRGGQFSHIQMLMTCGMPLGLLGLHRYVAGGGIVALALFGVGWLFTALSNLYLLLFFAVYVGSWVLWFCTTRDKWRRVPGIAAAGTLASIPLLPIVLTYAQVHSRYGFTRSTDEIRSYAADVSGLFLAHPAASVATKLVPWLHEEGALFPGFGILVLGISGAVCGIAKRPAAVHWRWVAHTAVAGVILFCAATIVAAATDVRLDAPIRLSLSHPHKPMTGLFVCLVAWVAISPRMRAAIAARDAPLFYAVMAGLMWLLSLGPEARLWGEEVLYHPPYAWLLKLPGMHGLRVPSRFWMLGIMSLCVLGGYAIASVKRRQRAAVVVVTAIVLAEGWMRVAAAPVPERFGPQPAIAGAPVLELPLGAVMDDIAAQFRGVMGGYRTLNGYSGYAPPHMPALRVGVQLRDGAVLTEMRRLMPLHVSVIADDSDRHRSWVTGTQQDARPVSAAAGRVLYFLPRLPAPQAPAGEWLPFSVMGSSCSQNLAPFVVDGLLLTRWECGPARPGQQITIDLHRAAAVSGVSLVLGPYSGDAPRNLLVEASEDSVSWRTVWSGLSAGYAVRAAMEDPFRMDIRIPFPPALARFVRLTQTGDAMEMYWSIAELGIQGRRSSS